MFQYKFRKVKEASFCFWGQIDLPIPTQPLPPNIDSTLAYSSSNELTLKGQEDLELP